MESVKVMKRFIVVSILAVLISCTPAVRKKEQVVASGSERGNSQKDSLSHVVEDVVPALESLHDSTAGNVDWYTKDKSVGGEFADIRFEYNSFSIPEEALRRLAVISSLLARNSGIKLVIEGHCDERGSDKYNLALGEKRANSVAAMLIELGAAKDRLSTVSYGEERPLNHNRNEEAWAQNRRVHFEVLK